MRKLILLVPPAMGVALVVAKKRGVFEDYVHTAENHVGVICIHHPQRWKVWRRGKRTGISVHYTPASQPEDAWEIPYQLTPQFLMAARFGEAAAVHFADTYGSRVIIIP